MTTPTREQECKHERIKTWVFEDTKEPAMWSCAECLLKFAPEMATLTAGRAQGLREAAARARSEGIAGISADDDEIVAEWLDAAAIEQLRA